VYDVMVAADAAVAAGPEVVVSEMEN